MLVNLISVILEVRENAQLIDFPVLTGETYFAYFFLLVLLI